MKTLLLALISFLCCPVYAESIILEDKMFGKPTGKNLEIVADAQGSLELEEIANDWQKYEKVDNQVDIPELGSDYLIYWMKLTLENTESSPKSIIVEHDYPTDYISFHFNSGESFFQTRLGYKEDQLGPAIMHRYSAVSLKIPPGKHDLFVRIDHQGVISAPIKIWTEREFRDSKFSEYLALGTIIGIAIAMLFYNIFLYFTTKETTYLYYVGYLFSNGIYLFFYSGVGTFISHEINIVLSHTWMLSMFGMAIFFSLFTMKFLQITKEAGWVYQFFKVITLANCVFVLVFPFNNLAAFVLSLLTVILVLMASIAIAALLCFRKYRPAYFYLISFSPIILASLDKVLSNFIAGYGDPGFWTHFVASSLQMVFLSLGIGDKMYQQQKKDNRRIERLNAELQKTINEINQIVEEKTRDIRSILTNIKQGIFMILPNSRAIHKDYSNHLKEIFEISHPEQMSGFDILFSNSTASKDQISSIKSTVETSIGEDSINYESNTHFLIREFSRYSQNQEVQVIELDWSPIIDKDDKVEKILVAARDVTEVRVLQRASHEREVRLSIIGELLKASADEFRRFITSSQQFIEENIKLASGVRDFDQEVMKMLFINVHTIKGTARSLGLSHFSGKIHEIEQLYDSIRNGNQNWDIELIENSFNETRQLIDLYLNIFTNDLGKESEPESSISIDNETVDQIFEELNAAGTKDIGKINVVLSKVKRIFEDLCFASAEKVLSKALSSSDQLAIDLEKEAPTIELQPGKFYFNRLGEDLICKVFVHMLRNSLDHGIETVEERLRLNKPPKGTIRISLEDQGDFLLINYADDGKGLDLDTIKTVAKAKGVFDESLGSNDQGIANHIFVSGFSTSGTITDISGRGVGMGAVKQFLQKMGGDINIALGGGRANLRSLSFNILIPKSCYLCKEELKSA